MFCEKCGAEIETGSSFCHKCGAMVNKSGPLPVQSMNIQNSRIHNEKNGQRNEAAAELKKQWIKKLPVVLAAMAIAVIAVVFMVNRKINVNLNKYLTVTVEGYDTLGKAEFQFDYNTFYEDYRDRIKIKTGNRKEKTVQDWMGDYYYAVELLTEYIDGSLSQSSKICNGDTVTFSWNCDDNYVRDIFNCKLVYSDINVQVSNLQEVQTFDPFEDVEITVNGTLPRASISVRNNSSDEALSYINFSTVPDPTLRNGGKLTVKASIAGSEETFVEKFGKMPYPTEKQYEVNGFDEYIFTQEQIPEEDLENLKLVTAKELLNESWSSTEKVENVTFLGTYILSKKPQYSVYLDYGSIYYVCKVKVNCSLDTTEGLVNYPVEYFYYVKYNNPVLGLDGDMTVTYYTGPFNEYHVNTGYYTSNGIQHRYFYYGYESLEELYNDVVVANSDEYNCEENIDESLLE